MKKLLFLFLLICCCACEEDRSVDPTLMPEATTTGENTLGCLIDGWVYTSGRYGIPSARFYDEEENHYVAIDAEVGIFSGLHLVIVNPRQGASCTYIDAVFDREDSQILDEVVVVGYGVAKKSDLTDRKSTRLNSSHN